MTNETNDTKEPKCKRPVMVKIIESGWDKARPIIECITVIALLVGLLLTFLEYKTARKKEDEADTALRQATNALGIAHDSRSNALSALAVANNTQEKTLKTIDSVKAAHTQISNLLFSVQNRQKEVFTLSDTNRLLIAEKDDGGVYVFFRLSKVPIVGSVDIDVPIATDLPGASLQLAGNIHMAAYAVDYDSIKKERLVVTYYPDFDQSAGGQMVDHTTNQVYAYNSSTHTRTYRPELFKRFATP